MSNDHNNTSETPTRRDYMKYSGAVIGGGLLAGCTGSSGSGGGANNSTNSTNSGSGANSSNTPNVSTSLDSSNSSGGGTTTGSGGNSYSVTMSPAGKVIFEQPPESVLTILPHLADMATAAGHGDAVSSMLYHPEYNATMWNKVLKRLDGVSVEWADLPGSWNPSKELLYELDSDLHLADPAYMTTMKGWDTTDIKEISKNVSPWFGNALSNSHKKPPSGWSNYQYYTLWEIFEKVARVFRAEARYKALADIHTEMLDSIKSKLPPEDKRPTAAMIILNQSKESMYVYALNGPGFMTAHTRPLRATDVFADVQSESTVGFESLIEANPDVILCLAGMSDGSRSVTKARKRLENNATTRSVSAVKNDRIHAQGARNQGPLMNLFQTEMTAKQLYPDVFGKWPTYTKGPYPKIPADEQLFDRQRVADIINGDI